MADGTSGPKALDLVLANDESADSRQIGVVDAVGRSAAWTGKDCTSWFGQIVEPGFTVQGNMLVGEKTLTAMAASFCSNSNDDLAERLVLALEAGDAAGGDKRGKQSAALRVHHTPEYPWLDLRVDEHAKPVSELRRILTIARQQLVPFIDGMPKRGKAAGVLPNTVTQMLLQSPPTRPGGGGSAP